MKPLAFVGSAREDLKSFPDDARKIAGFELWMVQDGQEPSDWKPMPAVGPGTFEIRIHAGGEWRILYVAKYADAIYVLHAFQKKTQKTTSRDIELARKRYQEIAK